MDWVEHLQEEWIPTKQAWEYGVSGSPFSRENLQLSTQKWWISGQVHHMETHPKLSKANIERY
jgi:hypothetical protein